MFIKYSSLLILATILLASFTTVPAWAGSEGNTIENVDVYNGMGSGDKPTNRTRKSRSEVKNPSGANVHSDVQVGASDSCGKSTNTNNTSHSGSVGSSVSVNVDVCNPIYTNSTTRGR
jgi:hypothetical protein